MWSASVTTIFLDRDGVINENRSDYVKSWNEFHFLPESLEAIAKLTQAGYRIIVCTNQAGIARGSISLGALEDIHRRMRTEVANAGGYIDAIYYCPHAKDANCACRKPRPGMLLRAHDELHVDLSESILIGDSITDIRAGQAAGVHCMLVLTGLGREQLHDHYQDADSPFLISPSLKQAAELIVQGLRVPLDNQSVPNCTSSLSYKSKCVNGRVPLPLGAR
jgi:D-glycero-D-manno-heptose 1,7-bisphosphate phosphatase